VSSFPQVAKNPENHEDKLCRDLTEEGEFIRMSLAELYEQFRALVMQMSVCSGKLGKLPANCSWTVSVELMEDAKAPPKDVSVLLFMRRYGCLFC
jgi:hypothetical protein